MLLRSSDSASRPEFVSQSKTWVVQIHPQDSCSIGCSLVKKPRDKLVAQEIEPSSGGSLRVVRCSGVHCGLRMMIADPHFEQPSRLHGCM